MKPISKETRRLIRIRLLVFTMGLATALLSAFLIWKSQGLVERPEDGFGFAEAARNVLNGNGLVQSIEISPGEFSEHRARRAPFYPLFIAALFSVGGDHPALIQLAQCVLAGGICLLVFEIGRLAFARVRSGVISAVMCAFHPMVLRYVPDIHIEIVMMFLITLATWRSLKFVEKPTVLNGLLFGAAVACGALTKPVALPYAMLFIVSFVAFHWLARRRAEASACPLPVKGLLSIILAMAILILPWTYRNYRVIGEFVLISTNSGGEFLRGYIYAEPDYFLLRKGATTDAEARANTMEIDLFAAQGKVWQRDEKETEAILNHEAKAKLLAEPGAFIKKMFVNFFMYWYVATTKLNSLIVAALSLAGWSLALLAIKAARDQGRKVWPLLIPILSFNLTYAAVLALARYSAPVTPVLMVLAGFGVDTLISRWRNPKSAVAPAIAKA